MAKLYIAYGSNLNMEQMRDRCPTAQFVGTGIIQNYELQFKGSLHNAHATIAPAEGQAVPVGIWKIQKLDEMYLDFYEGYHKTDYCYYDKEHFEKAVEDGNSFAEYQLGKIYYFGNGIRADTEKGLEYLRSAATHGNVYAANLLQAIQHQQTAGAAQCATSLIAQLGRMFQEQEQQTQRQIQRMDRKYRREIQEKKQAMGLRD